jgi:hypothetical protein
MKRFWPVLVISGVAGVASAQVGFEQGYARPGGVYAAAPGETAQACARLCADDSLCMSWTYDEGQCELKAVIAPAVLKEGAVSGLSQRAPNLANLTGLPVPPTPAAPAAETEAKATETIAQETSAQALQAQAAPEALEAAFARAESAQTHTDEGEDSALMGGVGEAQDGRDAPLSTNNAQPSERAEQAPPPVLRARISTGRPAG